jgi:hypothetical protein
MTLRQDQAIGIIEEHLPQPHYNGELFGEAVGTCFGTGLGIPISPKSHPPRFGNSPVQLLFFHASSSFSLTRPGLFDRNYAELSIILHLMKAIEKE